ncbi:MAG: hypothetical protein ACE149_14940 [Armatimonadota bacterium]
MVIRCARAGAADAIVTGDKDLLELDGTCGLRVVTPRALIRLLEPSTEGQSEG